MDSRQQALVDLGIRLQEAGYRFITPAPFTHAIVNGRAENERAASLAGVFGWSRPFAADLLGRDVLDLMTRADVLAEDGVLLRSTVRFSSLDTLLIAHSAYPTLSGDAVFFGPDTYRMCRAVRAELAADPDFGPATIIDVGAGSGAIGLYAASLLSSASRLILTDISERSLRMCEVNAALNGISGVEVYRADVLAGVPGRADLILANPPFMVDRAARLYRDGGGEWGLDLSRRIVEQALARLGGSGRLMLYTGTPVVNGADLFREAIDGSIDGGHWSVRYAEVASDIFPEELGEAPYSRADRIAAVFLVAAAAPFRSAQ